MAEQPHDDDFWREVSRMAHELEVAHGLSASSNATKLAERTLAEGRSAENAFWKAVAASLTPR